MTQYEYVANALMKAWFSHRSNDSIWLDSEDGKRWLEISILDAKVAVDAANEWVEKFGDDLK